VAAVDCCVEDEGMWGGKSGGGKVRGGTTGSGPVAGCCGGVPATVRSSSSSTSSKLSGLMERVYCDIGKDKDEMEKEEDVVDDDDDIATTGASMMGWVA